MEEYKKAPLSYSEQLELLKSRGLTVNNLAKAMLFLKPEWQAFHFNNQRTFASIAIMEWICRKAELPLCNIEPVYETMRKIAALDTRFASWMGVPNGRSIGMCWEARP